MEDFSPKWPWPSRATRIEHAMDAGPCDAVAVADVLPRTVLGVLVRVD